MFLFVANALGDRAFTNEPNIITAGPRDNLNERDLEQMAHRVRIENTFGEFEASSHAFSDTWRHKLVLNAPTQLLAAELFNYFKRIRLAESLREYDEYIQNN